ncbi:MAG: gliding motility-associated C-terminal domain-containing protein [Cyclobacteriaceae bacterium]
MKRLFILCTWVLMLIAAHVSGQGSEICNNGRDDDGDGFIDCYDNNCSASTFCKDFYLGDEALCQAIPPAFPKFTMSLDFSSPNETTNHLSRMAVGDLNRDGKPEIITMNKYTDKVFILNGTDGSIQREASVDFDPGWEIAIANIDNDNCGEIFFFGDYDPPGDNNNGSYLFAYDCNLNFIWRTAERLRGDPINFGLADFDGDGRVELYAKDEIHDAHTGVRIVKSTGATWNRINGGPVAVDIEGDDKLELVIGCSIYSVNLATRTLDAGSLTLLKSASQYFVRNEYNATSIADYNQDGFLDVLASGSTNSNGANTTVFFWDVRNNSVQTYSDPIPGNITIFACPDNTGEHYKDGWKNGTGRINIGDLDGDGKLNASYVSGKYLYALDENLSPLSWSPKLVNEETSGHTGCTLFDFNGDGKSEIVYRDERFLYIINGTDGSIYNQQACVSRTNREYPIVADVDADGSTELCVTCGFDDNNAINNFCSLGYSRYSHVRVFKSASDPWVPARRVWNQHGYFNVNVNDDLTIPIKQQKHHMVFSTGSCTVGPNRPLNTFLNQTPFLNRDGCPTYKSPDLAYVDNSLTVTPPTCPNGAFTVSFQIKNEGDIGLSGNVPITFYNGNPTVFGARKISTIIVPLNDFQVNDTEPLVNILVNGPGGPFTLYIVLNDAGTTVPTPISLPNTNFLECDYNDNIISAPVNPLPVGITALKVQDNIKCLGSSSPNNGAVRAFVPVAGGGENSADYNFYWSVGNIAKPVPADYSGATVNNIPDGIYTVFAIHKTANCNSSTAQVTVGRVDKAISITIEMVRADDNCSVSNGSLRAIVNDTDGDGTGDPTGNFTYAWYEGNDIFTDPLVSISYLATGLKARTYTVLVTDPVTGCQSINSRAVPDLTSPPVVSASAVNIICSTTNSGSVSANVVGTTTGFTFAWYRGSVIKPSPDFTTSTVNNVTTGNYTVVATATVSQCQSLPVTVTVNQSTKPVISASAISPMTSCNASLPNGSASASVSGGTSTYSFEWFRGQNTLAVNRVSTNASATGLAANIYTVKVTDTATGCFETAEVTITYNVVTPTLILAAVGDLTNCTTPNGSVTVNVTLDTPADYIFNWYSGTVVKVTPDFADQDNVLSNLPIGTYTVQAVHRTKNCITTAVQATVKDNTPTILINLNAAITVLPSVCVSPTGVMQVTVSAPGNISGFNVQWFYGRLPFAAPPVRTHNSVFTSTASGLRTGIYTVVATNRDNGCQASDEFNLPFADAHGLNLISKTDIDKCIPTNTGTITVDLIPTPLAGFNEGDYDILLYSGTNDTGVPLQVISGVVGITQYTTMSTLTPAFYNLVAVSKNILTLDCRSVPLLVEIQQIVSYPSIVATQIDANTNCSGATANGQIQIDVDGPTPETNYSFVWFEGPNTASPVLGTGTTGTVGGIGEIASNLPVGVYTVEVTNTTAVSTGCSATATFEVFDNPPVISIATADLSIVDVSLCSNPNGASVTVNGIREGASPALMANYSFIWLDANQNILPSAGAPNNTNTISNLPAGIYYVQATKDLGANGLSCASALIEFAILDKTIGSVTVDLTTIIEPTRCLQPANITGELHALASGNSTTGYTYSWHPGPDTSAPSASSSPNLTGITIPVGQTDITYTVQVTNNSNSCLITATYVLPLDIVLVTISASASPLTFCSSDNGGVFATVNSGSSNNYNYQWYVGSVVKATIDFNGKQNTTLPTGNYTVVSIDQADAFCTSTPETVTIENLQVIPNVTAIALEPLTMCDPAKPDGVASAAVNGDVINYSFEWYHGNTPSGVPIFTGSEINNLQATTYSVVATNLVTGCSDVAQVTVNQNILAVPPPQVTVLSHQTSCINGAPNGALETSVDGNTQDFIFHWYSTNPGPAPDTSSAVFQGEIYSSLAVGTYYVSATSRVTGCTSGPGNNIILDAPVYPDFNFKVEPATCEGSDGFLAIYMLNNVDITNVIWENSGGTQIAVGPNLSEIPAGNYKVTVVSSLGCETSKEIEVGTDIRPFNGISRNSDGANDIFHINCIDEFPTNLVKIFNRAGTLVYEAAGYDNIDIYFDGKSNKGISLMGTNLPDGTYFYIIDKGNGAKPVGGYLEIVN